MKKILFFLLIVFTACDSWQSQVGKYTISGTISDLEDNDARLMTGVSAVVRDGEGKTVFSGDAIAEGTVGSAYSIAGIPQGEYELEFKGNYYKSRIYDVTVDGDTELDVELEPVHMMIVGQQEVRFESRVSQQTLSVKNLSDKEVTFKISSDLTADDLFLLEMSAPGLRQVDSGWLGTITPSSSVEVAIRILRNTAEDVEGTLHISSTHPYKWERYDIPFIVETSEKDLYADLRGTVRDTAGNPLEGVAVWNNCTETIVFTDENGEYSFESLSPLSMIQAVAYSEYHNVQSQSEEYDVREFTMDFALEPVDKHIVFDRKTIDFGAGVVVPGAAKETIIVNASCDAEGAIGFSLVRTTGEVDFAVDYTPASGAFVGSRKFTFSLDRERSAGKGEYKQNIVIQTIDAGSYVFPVTYEIID